MSVSRVSWLIRTAVKGSTGGILLLVASSGTATDFDGEAARGRQVVESRGCIACHSLGDTGGNIAADLGRRSVNRMYTPSKFASLLWSHGPEMWREMEAQGREVQPMTREEVTDLFTYFWSIRYFDPPGEAIRGKRIFIDKGCAACHLTQASEETPYPPAVSEWSGLVDPVAWASQLWRHSEKMAQAFAERDLVWPTFSEQEMIDLLLYLQNLRSIRDQPRRLALRSPEAGEAVFADSGCSSCHTVGGEASGKRELAISHDSYSTLTGFTAAMWNHSPQMRNEAAEQDLEMPDPSVEDIRRIVSYLYFNGAFEVRGDADRGRRLFARNGCESCHPHEGTTLVSEAERGTYDVAQFAAATWSHGPEMERDMRRQGKDWPKLKARDVDDLIAFLNRP
jgi:cytochrome c551/c552